MENKEKLISLFKCIRELCGLKYKLITNIEKQVWYKFIDDIPEDIENIKIYDINILDDKNLNQADDKVVLLEVSKPEFYPCPPLPELLYGWIENDWKKYTNEIEVIEINEETEEGFVDSDERTDAFNTWKPERDKWVQEQLRIERTRDFFTELYYNYTMLDRESESIEMMVGEGLLEENPKTDIYHPVLLKKVKMEFDSENNVIRIVDTDADNELNTVLLQNIDYINHDSISKLKEQINNDDLHPLDKTITPVFLKSLIHGLCSNSKFKESYNTDINNDDKLIMSLRPVFFIKRRDGGIFNAIDDIIGDIDEKGITNGPLLDIIGGEKVDEKNDDENDDLSSINGEDSEVLLCKDANEEQLEIAKRIENYNAVLVQGPPGTGKTHTIANLIGHFLSQGKNILVTSHTKKALNVLVDKVPEQLQSLCVSLLDDTNKDMERSIDGISEIISAHSTFELKVAVDELKVQSDKILKELTEIRTKITTIKFKEYQSIVYNGKGYSIKDASTFVNQNADRLSYIPGTVKLYRPLPVSLGDFDILYHTNEALNPNEEIELKYNLPNPELLISPYNFKKKVNELNILKNRAVELEQSVEEDFKIDIDYRVVRVHNKSIVNSLNADELLHLKNLVNNIDGIDEWLAITILDGIRGGGHKDVWNKLINEIEDTVKYASNTIGIILGNKIVIQEDIDNEMLNMVLNELLTHFYKGKKITKLDRLLHKSWVEVIENVKINDYQISCADDCNLVLSYINLNAKRKSLGILWDELVYKNGGPSFTEFGDEPERTCFKRLDKIKSHLNWKDNILNPLKQSIISSGLEFDVIFSKKEYDTDMEELHDKINVISKLPLYIEAIEIAFLKYNEVEKDIIDTKNILNDGNLKKSDACSKLLKSINNSDIIEYEVNYDNYKTLHNKVHYLNERNRILNLLRYDAPDWAANIENRIGIHGNAFVPANIEDAWKWKQLSGIIDEIIEEPFESLVNKSIELNLELKKATEELAVAKGWFYLLQRIENDVSKQRALMGWKLTTKKIGKKTKNGPRLRQQARELMVECQSAVPVWVMTINKALESLKPSVNKFDIVIIDESSQSDVSTLPILYLAKKIIIVGDDEQVSPSAVGVEQDKVNAVQDMYIKNIIANHHLYDLKTSIYDLASTTFTSIMLKEHFRSVPDIIGYSNKLSYNYKIKPLRDESSSILKPATISYRVNGIREYSRKINRVEADNIVALMMACMEQPEYDGKTFGAISLLGDSQARLINEIAIQKMNLKEYEQRKIMCGNASQFQGDERDVIFISLVDNNEGEGPLRLTGEGADKSTKQRYNVAVSRAKDQVWVVHSLDVYNDLKIGDMRRDLLEYIENPKSFRQLVDDSDSKSESEFEKQVCRRLIARGYHIKQQWEVGAYRIDIVVICRDKKIAIECDGDRYHSGEDKLISDIKRQAILERLGWRFIRIRGSEYFRYPEEAMERVFSELEKHEIFPETIIRDTTTDDFNSDLFNRIKTRAFQIIQQWEEDNGKDSSYYSSNISKDFSISKEVSVKSNINKEALKEKEVKKKINKQFDEPISVQIALPDMNQETEKTSSISYKIASKEDKHMKKKNEENKNIIQSKSADSISINKYDIVEKLIDKGYAVIDNRKSSDLVWVIYDDTSNKQLESIIGNKYKVILDLRGSKATQNKPAWRITKNK